MRRVLVLSTLASACAPETVLRIDDAVGPWLVSRLDVDGRFQSEWVTNEQLEVEMEEGALLSVASLKPGSAVDLRGQALDPVAKGVVAVRAASTPGEGSCGTCSALAQNGRALVLPGDRCPLQDSWIVASRLLEAGALVESDAARAFTDELRLEWPGPCGCPKELSRPSDVDITPVWPTRDAARADHASISAGGTVGLTTATDVLLVEPTGQRHTFPLRGGQSIRAVPNQVDTFLVAANTAFGLEISIVDREGVSSLHAVEGGLLSKVAIDGDRAWIGWSRIYLGSSDDLLSECDLSTRSCGNSALPPECRSPMAGLDVKSGRAYLRDGRIATRTETGWVCSEPQLPPSQDIWLFEDGHVARCDLLSGGRVHAHFRTPDGQESSAELDSRGDVCSVMEESGSKYIIAGGAALELLPSGSVVAHSEFKAGTDRRISEAATNGTNWVFRGVDGSVLERPVTTTDFQVVYGQVEPTEDSFLVTATPEGFVAVTTGGKSMFLGPNGVRTEVVLEGFDPGDTVWSVSSTDDEIDVFGRRNAESILFRYDLDGSPLGAPKPLGVDLFPEDTASLPGGWLVVAETSNLRILNPQGEWADSLTATIGKLSVSDGVLWGVGPGLVVRAAVVGDQVVSEILSLDDMLPERSAEATTPAGFGVVGLCASRARIAYRQSGVRGFDSGGRWIADLSAREKAGCRAKNASMPWAVCPEDASFLYGDFEYLRSYMADSFQVLSLGEIQSTHFGAPAYQYGFVLDAAIGPRGAGVMLTAGPSRRLVRIEPQ